MKAIISFLFILFLSITSYSQEETVVIKKSTALKAEQAFREIKESRILITQLEAQAEEYKAKEVTYQAEIKLKDEQLVAKDAIIQGKNTQILALQNQKCNQTSFLFGLVKIKRCG